MGVAVALKCSSMLAIQGAGGKLDTSAVWEFGGEAR